MDEIEFTDAMSVRVYGEHLTAVLHELGILIRQIETIGTRVNLKNAAVPFRMCEDLFEVEIVRLSLEWQPSGRMPKDVEQGIVHRSHNPFCLLLAIHGKARVDRADCQVEFLEHIVVIVERSVLNDVNLSRLKDREPVKLRVKLVDRFDMRESAAFG